MEQSGYLRVMRSKDEESIVIDADYKGLLSLKEHIESLLRIDEESVKKQPKDVLLMIPEYGGNGLNNIPPSTKGWILIPRLKIYRCEQD